jgi:hypothetical protein
MRRMVVPYLRVVTVSASHVRWRMKLDEELQEHGSSFEENGKGLGYFCDGVGVVEEEREDGGGANEVLDTEGVDGRVIRWPETFV